MYSINPHENDHKKVRGVCDGSTRGGQTMVHGANYAPTPQHIYFRLKIALSELLGIYLWHANVTNALPEAEHPDQIYCMCCDLVFQDWWADKHPDIPLPPDAVVPVLKDLKCHPKGPRMWAVRCHMVIVTLKIKNTTHAPYLYHGTFNDEIVLFL
jgi:hypothetical protein